MPERTISMTVGMLVKRDKTRTMKNNSQLVLSMRAFFPNLMTASKNQDGDAGADPVKGMFYNGKVSKIQKKGGNGRNNQKGKER